MAHDERAVVVFAGGGTGGHLYPALAIAQALVDLRPDVRPWFVGASRGIEARVLPERGLDHLLLPVRGLERGAALGNFRVLVALLRSLGQVAELFQRVRPRLVVVTGGYAGGPAGILAAAAGIPLALQEQNSVPGVTTRLLSRFARQVHVAFPETRSLLPGAARARVLESGNPVRPPSPVDRAQARRSFGLSPDARIVLVVGGSQGSLALNEAVLEAVRDVEAGALSRPPGLELLWATGPTHLDAVLAGLAAAGNPAWVKPVGYLERMERALGAADLAVSRAGAMATAEFLAWGLPSVLVPLPTAAADHQTMNARALEASGAATHLPQVGLDGASLWRAVAAAVGDPGRLEAQRASALRLGRPQAARVIAASLAALLPPPSAPSRGPGWESPERSP